MGGKNDYLCQSDVLYTVHSAKIQWNQGISTLDLIKKVFLTILSACSYGFSRLIFSNKVGNKVKN